MMGSVEGFGFVPHGVCLWAVDLFLGLSSRMGGHKFRLVRSRTLNHRYGYRKRDGEEKLYKAEGDVQTYR